MRVPTLTLLTESVFIGDMATTTALLVSVIAPWNVIVPTVRLAPCIANFASLSVRLTSSGISTSLGPAPFPITKSILEPFGSFAPA
jgi:hypothetical protein